VKKIMAPRKKYMEEISYANDVKNLYPNLFTDREKQAIDLYIHYPVHEVVKIMEITDRGLYEHLYRILAKMGIESPAMKWKSRTKIREFYNQSVLRNCTVVEKEGVKK
jgi:hypothetical protein